MTYSANRYRFLLLILLTLLGYILPWVHHSTTALSMGAFDLAEWTSLHPTARVGAVPFLAVLLLRLPLVLIALIAALAPFPRLVRFVAVTLFAISLLPPFEFFLTGLSDPNYRQQFLLSLITLILGTLAILYCPGRWRRTLLIGLVIVMLLSSIIGLLIAMRYLTGFGLHMVIGPGAVLISLLGLIAVTLLLRKQTG